MKKKPKLVLNIKGIDWTFNVQTETAFRKMHGLNGKNAEAIIYPHDREVYFSSVYLSPYSVRHELAHVYVASTNTSSMTSMTVDDMEELFADIIGEHLDQIQELTSKILNHFLR